MPFGQRHSRIETDNPKTFCDIDNQLNHRFANFRQQIIQLNGIVPGQMSSVIPMVNESDFTALTMLITADHSCFAVIKITVLNLH